MKKRVLFFLMSLILICQMSLTAYAAEVPDMNRKGTISITMRQGDTVVPGGELNLYRVGEVKEENGDYSIVANLLKMYSPVSWPQGWRNMPFKITFPER